MSNFGSVNLRLKCLTACTNFKRCFFVCFLLLIIIPPRQEVIDQLIIRKSLFYVNLIMYIMMIINVELNVSENAVIDIGNFSGTFFLLTVERFNINVFPLCMDVAEAFYWRRPRSGAKLSTSNCKFTSRFYSIDSPSVCDNPKCMPSRIFLSPQICHL